MTERYRPEAHQRAKALYKFVTVRLPLDDHAARSFKSQNEAILFFLTYGIETWKMERESNAHSG